jgi:hypothetical protein
MGKLREMQSTDATCQVHLTGEQQGCRSDSGPTVSSWMAHFCSCHCTSGLQVASETQLALGNLSLLPTHIRILDRWSPGERPPTWHRPVPQGSFPMDLAILSFPDPPWPQLAWLRLLGNKNPSLCFFKLIINFPVMKINTG